MIIDITEYNYMGFHLEHVKDKGWKIVLGDVAYLFPHAQAAESAIRSIHEDIVQKHKASKIKK